MSNVSNNYIETNKTYSSDDNKEPDKLISNFNEKYDYKEFTKTYLKIKFENLHNRHEGQKIPRKVIWKEACNKGIPKHELNDFILNELKNVEKYSKFLKNTKSIKMFV